MSQIKFPLITLCFSLAPPRLLGRKSGPRARERNCFHLALGGRTNAAQSKTIAELEKLDGAIIVRSGQAAAVVDVRLADTSAPTPTWLAWKISRPWSG